MGFGLDHDVPCLGLTHLFYIDKKSKDRTSAIRRAKKICSQCEWRFGCWTQGNFTAHNTSSKRDMGIWAGLSEGDRKRFRRLRIEMTPDYITDLLRCEFGEVVYDRSLQDTQIREQSHHLCEPDGSCACGVRPPENQPTYNPVLSALVDSGAFAVYEVRIGGESYLLPLLRAGVSKHLRSELACHSQGESDSPPLPKVFWAVVATLRQPAA